MHEQGGYPCVHSSPMGESSLRLMIFQVTYSSTMSKLPLLVRLERLPRCELIRCLMLGVSVSSPEPLMCIRIWNFPYPQLLPVTTSRRARLPPLVVARPQFSISPTSSVGIAWLKPSSTGIAKRMERRLSITAFTSPSLILPPRLRL